MQATCRIEKQSKDGLILCNSKKSSVSSELLFFAYIYFMPTTHSLDKQVHACRASGGDNGMAYSCVPVVYIPIAVSCCVGL